MKQKRMSGTMTRTRRIGLLVLCVLSLALTINLTSCEAVRTISTTAEHVQRGDTSLIIQTKVIESYVGQKKGM
ncbi:MAG: hypothetical protein IKY87_01115 [Paludibacteraceae bacterium]|nr:hypothetical protein [Paludibacteraceae bacterium]